MDLKKQVALGDKVYIKAGSHTLNATYNGEVVEIEEHGIWVIESNDMGEFIAYADVLEWAVE